jgi:hypothetical protein
MQRDPIGQLDVEWLAMKAGLKPANRVTMAPERAGELEARAQRDGLFVARGARVVEFPGRAPAVVLYVARDAASVRLLAEAEAPLFPPESARLRVDEAVALHTQLGRLLGFPACCVAEFGVRLRRGVTRRLDGRSAHEDFVAAECAVQKSSRCLGRLNDLTSDRRARIVTFYPCRYDCAAAADYAAAVFAAAEQASPVAAAALRGALLGTVAIAADGSRGPADQLRGEVLTVTFGEF